MLLWRRVRTDVRADSVTGRVTVVAASGFSEVLTTWPGVKDLLSVTNSGLTHGPRGTHEEVFLFKVKQRFMFYWKQMEKKRERIRGTYAAIVYIQRPFKFKSLNKFSSACKKRKSTTVKQRQVHRIYLLCYWTPAPSIICASIFTLVTCNRSFVDWFKICECIIWMYYSCRQSLPCTNW